MQLSRREFLRILGMAGAAGMLPGFTSAASRQGSDIYHLERFGDVRLMHLTDTHAQLMPIYYREPSVNLGLGTASGRPPHLVTRSFAARLRGYLAGIGYGVLEPRVRHGGDLQPARCRCHDRSLGVHLPGSGDP